VTKVEVIQKIRESSSRLCLRANNVWAVSQDGSSLFLYKLQKGDSWTYDKISEENFDDEVSCPLGYLESTPAINNEWRDKVREHYNPSLLVKEIKKKFRKMKTGQLIIHTTSSKVSDLVMESAVPFQGRHNGILYDIPTTKVKGYTYEPAS